MAYHRRFSAQTDARLPIGGGIYFDAKIAKYPISTAILASDIKTYASLA